MKRTKRPRLTEAEKKERALEAQREMKALPAEERAELTTILKWIRAQGRPVVLMDVVRGLMADAHKVYRQLRMLVKADYLRTCFPREDGSLEVHYVRRLRLAYTSPAARRRL